MKTVIKILQENFKQWKAEEIPGPENKYMITTDEPVSDELKAVIERSATYFGGPCQIIYKTFGESQ